MGYHYKESGKSGWDVLIVTKKGMEEGGLPNGFVLLTGTMYSDRTCKKWLDDIRNSDILHVSVAKHCDNETVMTHISPNGCVNRFGFFLSVEDPFKKDKSDYDIGGSGWFRRQTVPDYKKFAEEFFGKEIICEYHFIVKDTSMETRKSMTRKHATQEAAWSDAILCASTFADEQSAKKQVPFDMRVDHKLQTITVIAPSGIIKRTFVVSKAGAKNNILCKSKTEGEENVKRD